MVIYLVQVSYVAVFGEIAIVIPVIVVATDLELV